MTISINNVGGTLTGGASVNLSQAGSTQVGKASFVVADSTRLKAKIVDFLVNEAKTTATDPGVARAGLKVVFTDRQSSDSCCTVQAGSVIVDVNVRWSLNQPESLVDDALDLVPSLILSSEFSAALKKGVLPA